MNGTTSTIDGHSVCALNADGYVRRKNGTHTPLPLSDHYAPRHSTTAAAAAVISCPTGRLVPCITALCYNMKCAAFLLAGGAVCAQAFMTAPLASTRTSTAARVSGLHMSATSELPTQVWYI